MKPDFKENSSEQLSTIEKQQIELQNSHKNLKNEIRNEMEQEKQLIAEINGQINDQYLKLKNEISEVKKFIEKQSRKGSLKESESNSSTINKIEKFEKKLEQAYRHEMNQMSENIDEKVENISKSLDDTKAILTRLEKDKKYTEKHQSNLKQSKSDLDAAKCNQIVEDVVDRIDEKIR